MLDAQRALRSSMACDLPLTAPVIGVCEQLFQFQLCSLGVHCQGPYVQLKQAHTVSNLLFFFIIAPWFEYTHTTADSCELYCPRTLQLHIGLHLFLVLKLYKNMLQKPFGSRYTKTTTYTTTSAYTQCYWFGINLFTQTYVCAHICSHMPSLYNRCIHTYIHIYTYVCRYIHLYIYMCTSAFRQEKKLTAETCCQNQ